MEEQLKAALELHEQGDLLKALQLYEKVLKGAAATRCLLTPLPYCDQRKNQQSIDCLKRGISFIQMNLDFNNLGNCHLDTTLTLAIGIPQSSSLKPDS